LPTLREGTGHRYWRNIEDAMDRYSSSLSSTAEATQPDVIRMITAYCIKKMSGEHLPAVIRTLFSDLCFLVLRRCPPVDLVALLTESDREVRLSLSQPQRQAGSAVESEGCLAKHLVTIINTSSYSPTDVEGRMLSMQICAYRILTIAYDRYVHLTKVHLTAQVAFSTPPRRIQVQPSATERNRYTGVCGNRTLHWERTHGGDMPSGAQAGGRLLLFI